MATNIKPRTKDHWSVRLKIQRPGTASRVVLLILALVQALVLTLTASAVADSGGLYGCSAPCGTKAQPTTPAMAVFLGILLLVLPVVIGLLCETWEGAITLAALPWWLAVIFTAGTLLLPAAIVSTGTPTGKAPATPPPNHFGAPFWLDMNHLVPLLLSLGLFALLGWLGWLARQSLREA
jgi:hypothetical protein